MKLPEKYKFLLIEEKSMCELNGHLYSFISSLLFEIYIFTICGSGWKKNMGWSWTLKWDNDGRQG